MSRIEESLYNSVGKYGISLNEDLIDDFYDTFDPDGDHESGLMAHDRSELDSWTDWLDDNDMDYDVEDSDDPDYAGVVYINEDINMTEAVNPENEEANAIIKKYLGKKKMPKKKEQEVLDRYGIKKDEYGRFVGPKGAILYGDRTSVMGPSKPGRTTRSSWGDKYRTESEPFGWFDKSKTGGEYTKPKDVDALDKIDYANFLTKKDQYSPRGKAVQSSIDIENEYAMKPFSEPYKELKNTEKNSRYSQASWESSARDTERRIATLQNDLEMDKKFAKEYGEKAEKAAADREALLAKAHAKRDKKNESMSLDEAISHDVTQFTVGDYIGSGGNKLINAYSIPVEAVDKNDEIIFSSDDIPWERNPGRRRRNAPPNKYSFDEILNMPLLSPPRVTKWCLYFDVDTDSRRNESFSRKMNEDVNPMSDFEANLEPAYQREYREADDDLNDKVIQYVKTILSITDDVTVEDLKKEVSEYVYNIIDNM